MNLSDLNPFPVYINWEGEAIELKPFSLRTITWAERFFYVEGESGFDRMNRILTNPDDQNVLFNTIIDVVYYLGSEDFKVNGPVELKKLVNENENLAVKLEEFKDGIQQVFKNSFPPQQKEQATGGEIFKKLTQKKKEGVSNQTDWEQIYVAFYMAGGMSLDDFYNLTMKQIDYLYPEINYKISEAFSLQASIHGAKLKNAPRRKQREEFTPGEVAAFEKMHKELMKENKVN